MPQTQSDQTISATGLRAPAKDFSALNELMLVSETQGKTYLVGIDSQSQLYKISSGSNSRYLGRLDGPTKAQGVWLSRNLPFSFVVSFLGSTSILCYRDGGLTEIDQAQTKLILGEATLGISDLADGFVVQASRYWINVFSARGNCMYRSSNGERIIAVSSSTHHTDVAAVLSDGDLVRGRSKVVILSVSETSGLVVEKHRREYNHEIHELVMLSDGSITAITGDKSILFLSPTLSLLANLTVDFPLKSISISGPTTVVVSTSTGIILALNTATRTLISSNMQSQRPITFGQSSNGLLSFSPGRYFCILSPDSVHRIHPPIKDDFISLTSVDSLYAGISSSGEVVIFECAESGYGDFDFDTVGLDTLATPLSGPIIQLSGGSLYLGGPAGCPVYIPEKGQSARTFPSMEGTVCGCKIKPDLLVAYSIHERALVVYKVIHSGNTVDIMRLFSRPVCASSCRDSSVTCITAIDDFAVISYDNGDVQKWRISDQNLPTCTASTTLGLSRAHSFIFPLDADQFVMVHSEFGVFTLNGDLQFTSVSPSFVERVALPRSISAACVFDREHVVTGDVSGMIKLHKIPFSRVPSSLEQCMNVTDEKSSTQAADGKITSLIHCRDKRKLVYFASEDPQVPLGLFSPVFPSNWYWD